MGCQVLLCDLVLAFSSAAVDDGNPVRPGEASHASTEAPCHAHQVRVVQLFFRAAHQTSPPFAEPAARVAQPEVGIKDDAIDAVIATFQQIAIPLAQLVGHRRRVNRPAPSGATPSGRRPRRSVAVWRLEEAAARMPSRTAALSLSERAPLVPMAPT